MGSIVPKRDRVNAGDRFGRWTALAKAFSCGRGTPKVVVQCDCGTVAAIQIYSLICGDSGSCGCSRSGIAGRKGRGHYGNHGGSKSRLYDRWRTMLQRCRDPKSRSWKYYGGRGIQVCDEWLDFKVFREWALKNGYADGLWLERNDGNGNYEPGNCTFATAQQQNRNRRGNRKIEAFGEVKLLCEWSEDPRCVVSRQLFQGRICDGWSAEAALTTPIRK